MVIAEAYVYQNYFKKWILYFYIFIHYAIVLAIIRINSLQILLEFYLAHIWFR